MMAIFKYILETMKFSLPVRKENEAEMQRYFNEQLRQMPSRFSHCSVFVVLVYSWGKAKLPTLGSL